MHSVSPIVLSPRICRRYVFIAKEICNSSFLQFSKKLSSKLQRIDLNINPAGLMLCKENCVLCPAPLKPCLVCKMIIGLSLTIMTLLTSQETLLLSQLGSSSSLWSRQSKYPSQTLYKKWVKIHKKNIIAKKYLVTGNPEALGGANLQITLYRLTLVVTL